MSVKAHLTGWQMVPTLRSNTETVPGKAGLADFGADSGERYIDVPAMSIRRKPLPVWWQF